MEEVDSIIFQALNQLGITLGDDINTLSDFPDELVFVSVMKCLDVISGNETSQIPSDTSGKIVVANDIVAQCTKLGFRGDLGYELMLYPNEVDLRRLFTFLIDKLPKESDKLFVPRDSFSLMMQNISQKISEELQKPWTPPFYKRQNIETPIKDLHVSTCKYLTPFNKTPLKISDNSSNVYEEFNTYWQNNVSNGAEIETYNVTPEMEQEAESIMELLKQSKTKISNLKMTSFIMDSNEIPSDRSRINPSLLSMKELADTIKQIEEDKGNMINKIKTLHAKRDKLSANIDQERKKESVLKEKKETHDLVSSLLPEFDTNIEKLKKIREKENSKLGHLKKEICALEDEAEKERGLNKEFKEKQDYYNNEISNLEAKRNLLSNELKKQSALKLHLRRDCEKRNIKKKYNKKRSVYTKRIMEIIGNVAKQKLEINKILSDTRVLQKEMNNLNGRLDRSFTVVDELVFKDAKKDEHARKTYKLIAYIHTGCGEIVNNVDEIGSNLREIRDLEKRVESEKKKKIEENLQRVYSDLKYLQSKKEKN